MDKKATEPKAASSPRKLVRSFNTCEEDDTVGLRPRLVSSQTRPALSNSVSKNSSTEFTDATATDLHKFIVQTLHKNQKDRTLILSAEHELVNLMRDASRQSISFQPMSSYERMIVHRVAAYFGLDHNVCQEGNSVVVSKTEFAKIPSIEFSDLIQNDDFTEPIKPGSGPRSNLLRTRHRSQNTENLSCGMSAPSFSDDSQKNYLIRPGEQTIPYYWVPTSTAHLGYQGQNYYYPTSTSSPNYVSMSYYQNLSPQPTQSYNYYPNQIQSPSYYYYSQGQSISTVNQDFNQFNQSPNST